jgi:hypothetical protein
MNTAELCQTSEEHLQTIITIVCMKLHRKTMNN